MENRYLDENGNPLGLMEIIRLEQEKNKLKRVDLIEELSKPWHMPTTNIILTGSIGADIFNNIIKEFS